MNSRFYESPVLLQNRALLGLMLLTAFFSGCKKTEKSYQHEQLRALIDSLDRTPRSAGVTRAIFQLDSMMGTLPDKTIHDSIAYYKFMKVLSHRDSTMDDKALLYTDSLLHLFDSEQVRNQIPTEYSKALLLKGDDLLKQKKNYLAYRNYYSGKSFLTSLGEICECARYSSRIANISFKEEQYYQAIEYWTQELKELAGCREADNFQLEFIEKQGSMRNIGIAYLRLNDPKKALDYFAQASRFVSKNAHRFPREQNFIRFARIEILKNQAEAYLLLGNTKLAEKLIRKCLRHDPEILWSIDVEREARQILTRIYILSRSYDKAQAQLDILNRIASQPKSLATAISYNKMQAEIAFGLGNYAGAAALLVDNLELERQAAVKKNRENRNNVGQLLQQVHYEHETQLAAEKSVREMLLLGFTILTVIALVIITYLIWRNAKRSAANLRAVTKLNAAITKNNIALQDTVNALEQAEIEKDELLRIVAHDLRNPVSAMISGSDMLFWDEKPSDEQAMIIDAIMQSGQMANGLIGQILQSGPDRQKLTKTEENLAEIVQSCIDMHHYKATEKQQSIKHHCEPVTIPVDREKIWRVFSNLLSNAIKFSAAGSIIQIRLDKGADVVLLSIHDSGIGIPDTLKTQIFLASDETRREGTEGEKSFGMGLSICRHIVNAHGGKIWFESESGVGTTFFVELPLGIPAVFQAEKVRSDVD